MIKYDFPIIKYKTPIQYKIELELKNSIFFANSINLYYLALRIITIPDPPAAPEGLFGPA